jgi:hypothetical protein
MQIFIKLDTHSNAALKAVTPAGRLGRLRKQGSVRKVSK